MAKLYADNADEMKRVWTMKGISDAVRAEWGDDPGWSSDTEFTTRMMLEK